MGNIRKSLSSILVLILALSISIAFTPAFAQTPTPSPVPIPTPSIPQFTVKFVNSSYVIPASSSINPYTSQNITSPSQYIENDSVQVIVNNQPFTPQWVQEGSSTFIDSLFYNVRMKGHFTDNWTELYNPNVDYPIQSNSNYTLVYSLNVDSNGASSGYQLDFQVQALIGAVHRGYNASATNQLEMYPYVFTGETSDWSNTQTITITEGSISPSSSPNPTPTPTVPEFSSWTIQLLLTIILASASLLVYHKNQKQTHRKNNAEIGNRILD